MKILFLHGWTSTPGGKKATFLQKNGHELFNPRLPDDDFPDSVRIAQESFDKYCPDVVVGSSRGGAVAMNLTTGYTPLVLLCPAWKKWGTVTTVKQNTQILHSRSDKVISFEHSKELLRNSGMSATVLVDVGSGHRLATAGALAAMLQACEKAHAQIQVTVYYLEMLSPTQQRVPAPRDGLSILHVEHPTASYYRFLYDSVGSEYNWRSRKKLTDEELVEVIQDARDEIHVLHIDGLPVGFSELVHNQPNDIELAHFGLVRDFIGQGLGKWLLGWTLDKAWSYQPDRIWLHTCTMDHPNALTIYQKAGFKVFKKEEIRREL